MKKIFAFLIVILIVLSLTACNTESEDKAITTATVATDEQSPTTATQDETTTTATADSVEEWIELHRDFIDDFCAQGTFEEDGISNTMKMEAKGNDLYIYNIIAGYTEEQIALVAENAVQSQSDWDAQTAEEKAATLENYFVFDESMPSPDRVFSIALDKDGNTIASTEYSK